MKALNRSRQPFMTDEYIAKNLCKGSIKNFRKPEILKIHNKFILALLYAFDSKTTDLAEYCNVTQKTIDTWIYKGAYPRYVSRQKICFYFNMPEEILFGSYARSYAAGIRHIKSIQGDRVSIRGNKAANIKKPLLYGLIWVYQIRLIILANEIGINQKMLQRILYTDKQPNEFIKNRLEEIFCIPKEILFMEELRTRTAERRVSGE